MSGQNLAREQEGGREDRLRTPPCNVEMERAVLGAILLDNDALPKALETLSGAEDFYRPAHRKIYECILRLFEKSEPVDLLTLSETLKGKGWLEDVGGTTYLAELLDSVFTPANVRVHARVVREKAVLRRLITVAGEAVTMAYDREDEVDAVVDEIERMILEVSQKRARGSFTAIGPALNSAMKTVEGRYENKNLITGVTTGYKYLDEKTAGLQKSDLVIIAGRPSMGKTAFALNIIQNYTSAVDEAVVAVFSLEMSAEQLVMRLLSSEARVDAQKMRTGFINKGEWSKLALAAGRMYKRQVHIDDTPAMTVMEMRGKARRLQAEKGRLDLVVIDYLQLMDSPATKRAEGRVQEISSITRSLKQLAKELAVPVVVISQLSRKVEDRVGSKRPQLSDLRESGSIEQDADLVLFVYREEYYAKDKPEAQNIAEIIIGKQRNGPLDTIKLSFLKEYTRFENFTREEGGPQFEESYT